jgi:hypothetical protein
MTPYIKLALVTNIRPPALVRVRLQGQSDALVAGASAVCLAAVTVGKKSRSFLKAVFYFAVRTCSVENEGLTHVEVSLRG